MRIAAVTAFALMVLGACASPAPAPQDTAVVAVRVVSSDPARITGGDALIEIEAPQGTVPVVRLNAEDVSAEFAPGRAPGHHLGLVRGLPVGVSVLSVRSGARATSLTLVNHPIVGPVFAGAREKPFFCETTSFRLPDGSTLPPPIDEDCSVETVVRYFYRTTEGKLRPLPNLSELPADVARTTTSLGKTVPYVVRHEVGTINRGIYELAVLHDPTSEAAAGPTSPPQGWNGRLIYTFGGGCGGMYRQGPATAGVLDDQFIARGYLVASNSLNVFAFQCDDLLAAETMMMTRERAIERFGQPLFVLGWGCSGGSHQVLQIADNYPGLLDGIVPICNSVDFFRLMQHTADARLLYDWFKQPAAQGLSDEQKQAITGTRLNSSAGAAQFVDATNCPKIVPAADVFHPERNPGGLRCAQGDHLVNSLGRDPATGYGWSLFDNVGVQYGLQALKTGRISVDQFLDLNEQVGGYDRNGARSPQRAVAEPRVLETLYRTGRVFSGGGGLKSHPVPILELRNYSDRDASATHLKYGTFAFLARLERETGTRANYVSLLEPHQDRPYSASTDGGDQLTRYALQRMDEWLTSLAGDRGAGTPLERIVRAKPADLVDSCYRENGERIREQQTFTGGECARLYPAYPPPRQVAGGPMANDVLKCQLKPPDPDDYPTKFDTAQWARLQRIFPTGVCDWSRPGVGQVPLAGVWLRF